MSHLPPRPLPLPLRQEPHCTEPYDCGSYFATPYFVTFTVFSTFVTLNMVPLLPTPSPDPPRHPIPNPNPSPAIIVTLL